MGHRSKTSASLMLAVAALLLNAGALSAQLTQPLGDLANAFTWRSIGPANISGRVTDDEGLPFPSKTFYVTQTSSVERVGSYQGGNSPFEAMR